ncbi:glycoside hydrolase family 2 TIM barrel-domain containing protein [Hymenobacter jeollabukensis]|uniref:Beta-galactosidase n=1 Tax=Hymenobacter jeollabukensis TaxID=2025313 RepID=A0A5R8WHG7_9BACT|nr:glycoside hydrolase family 2 TIM barrel-domain containing protein [Hymenobacter jeollabukensis]TLM87403.1 beta-galactosidase [Hymenobacter jeollabukensis]
MVFSWPVGAALRPLRAAGRLVLLLLLGLVATAGRAQGRITQRLNDGWLFRKDAARSLNPAAPPADGWEALSLPHTWNAQDVLDDEPGYYRGTGWYRKTLPLPADWAQRRLYLHFEGANQETAVYVNGRLVGRHAGGYTAFRVPLNAALAASGAPAGTAELLVKVDNRHNPSIPPLSADFTFYGGLYRDVYLLAAQPVHFDLDNYASAGVFVTTPQVSAAAATVQLRGAVQNDAATARTVQVRSRLLDAAGQLVAEHVTRLKLPAGQKTAFEQTFKPLRQPRLWSPATPYLYRAVSEVLDERGQALDEVTNPVGLRWFRFDAAQGFFLNGQPLKLIGTNRHQDQPGLGNALPDALHERDVRLVKQLGGNFLRVSHYPQDPTVLQACDRLGILASVEIPVVNAITESEAFYQRCDSMQTEMIRQGHNHPSVVLWAYMNEVLLQLPPGLKKDNDSGRAYLQNVARLAQRLDDLTRREDPARATMLVCHGAYELYRDAGLLRIPTVLGWNLYQGWYSPKLEDFPAFLERHRRELPDKPLMVTEYGADADIRLHSPQPRRFDKTSEYATAYHQYYLREMLARPFVAGSAVWNLAEFNSEKRQEAVPHVNNKGLMTGERQPKDAYLFYQARLLASPFLAIGARGWRLRAGVAAGPDSLYCVQPVDVFTNQPAVELRLNGRVLGTKPAADGVARFRVPFGPGLNQLTASVPGQLLTDQADIEFQLLPTPLAAATLPFRELNVSLGDERQFSDEARQQVWLPEQAYQPGGWGYVGGRAYKQEGNGQLPYGSARNILGTDYDALYQTQRVGLTQFRLDVPAGQYEVTLHFAELEQAPPAETLAYNLEKAAAGTAPSPRPTRSFDVRLNGQLVLPALGPDNYLTPLQAASFRFPVTVSAGQGITIDFKALRGESVLNGLQVKRLY